MTSRTATCGCGALRADCTGEPVRVSVCHCLACQKRSGSAFAVQARFQRASVVLHGESHNHVRIADSGRRTTFHFCPSCGATIAYVLEDQPEVIAIPLGLFDDPGFAAPTASVWEERKHRWVEITDPAVDHIA